MQLLICPGMCCWWYGEGLSVLLSEGGASWLQHSNFKMAGGTSVESATATLPEQVWKLQDVKLCVWAFECCRC